ncbi:MAG: hypothetical protein ABJN62_09700 [Halioglobus sp.]
MRWQVLAVRLDKPETEVLSKLATIIDRLPMVKDDCGDEFVDPDALYDAVERLAEQIAGGSA